MEMTKDIFISYSRKDKDKILNLLSALEAYKIKYWLDTSEIDYSDTFPDRIASAIDNADSVLFICTEKSLNASYCKKELNYARINDKKIRAVLLDGIVPRQGWFVLEYSNVNCVNYTDKSQVDKLMQELEDAYQPEAAEAHRQELEAAKEAAIQRVREEFERKKQQAAEEAARKERERLEKESEERKETVFTFTVKGVSFKMVKVSGGTFTMGATPEQGKDANDDERPVHKVTLSDYYIGQTEVTQALWTAVTGSNPSKFEGDNLPVEQVSWDDCQTFIEKLNSLYSNELGGKRFALPTEAQWEFAARGGNKSKGYMYAGSNEIDDVAWYSGNSGYVTSPVAQKKPNELGLYDMTGNVEEWCQDWYGDYSSDAQTNPQGPASGTDRVFRGGSWCKRARGCRVSIRLDIMPGGHTSDLGLRLCLLP